MKSLLRYLYLFFARNTDSPNQSLRSNQVYRCRQQEWFNSHIHEPADGAWRVICMQRAENEMSGQCCFDRNSGSLTVTDFSDQNDIGVLAQERAKSGCERRANLFVYLRLIDSRQHEFDRIFCRHDIRVRLIDLRDRRIQRIGFAAACWSGYQDYSKRLSNGR